MDTIEKKVLGTINKYRMITEGSTILAAVSGGPDSMVMLYILSRLSEKLNMSIICAHLNHNLRGKESLAEINGVKRFCKELEISLISETIPLKEANVLRRSRGSLEEKLREVRLNFLLRTAKKCKAPAIATAHNINDQAETFFLRLFRGASTKGLAGIPPVREPFIRPLIEVTKEEILDYANRKNIAYFKDSSNLNEEFLRNKIRHRLIPFIENNFSKAIIRRLAATAGVLSKESEALENLNESFSFILSKEKNGNVSLNLSLFLKLPEGIRIALMKKVIREVKGNLRKMTASHYFTLLNIASSEAGTKFINLPGGITAVKEYDRLIFGKIISIPDKYCISIHKRALPYEASIENRFLLKIETKNLKSFPLNKKNSVCLDYNKLEFPLVIRSYIAGDKFQPSGLNGTKKIKDFFIDKKIPLKERACYPLIISNGKIVSVAGLRTSKVAEIKDFPCKAVIVSFGEF